MLEIWQKCASFQTTSQRLKDHVKTIIGKDCFSDLEILEICQKTNNEQCTNTVSETLGFDKQQQSYRNEPQTLENRNATYSNNTEQTLTQEQKIDLENLKRIMKEQKTTLPP